MLTIGEVARRADIRASAIRFYEEKGLLPPAMRRGVKRVYGESILKRLVVIAREPLETPVKPRDVQRVSKRRFVTKS